MMRDPPRGGTDGRAARPPSVLAPSAPPGGPSPARWPDRPAEYAADALVHALWLGLAVLALRLLPWGEASPSHRAYAGTMLALAVVSLVNNVAPSGFARGWVRRLDRAAIYLFIAASVGAFLALAEPSGGTTALLVAVWAAAGLGAAARLALPGRLERAGLALYLGLGWCGTAGLAGVAPHLGAGGLALLLLGGLLYTAGVPFHQAERLPFRSAIWHGFVTVAAACHLVALQIGLEAANGP